MIHNPHPRPPKARPRRGAALFIVMMFVVVSAALALTAIVTTGNAALVAKSYARENDLKYAAEAALAIGKSRLNFDADALPDTGFVVLMSNASLTSADNQVIPGVKVTVYAGPSGSASGQFGRFASVVAEARDNQGNGFIRRLELTQESFAKYAYWSSDEGSVVFANGDNLWGPVWSNDDITINSSGATFHDEVATAKTIVGKGNGTFKKGYKEHQKAIALPTDASLQGKLSGFATASGWKFTAPTTGSVSGLRMRVEFVAIDLNADGDSTDANEGFFKVYESTNSDWARGDWVVYSGDSEYSDYMNAADVRNCGDWHKISTAAGTDTFPKFFPAAIHNKSWTAALWRAGGMAASDTAAHKTATLGTIMGQNGARCFLGGSPELVAVALDSSAFAAADKQVGGDRTTHYNSDRWGAYKVATTSPNSAVSAKRPKDANYLFPIHRSLNPAAKGVIYVTGTVGVSGTLRGKITLYSTTDIGILDDTRYSNDPGTQQCLDMLGLLSASDVLVVDNALQTPRRYKTGSTKNMDDTKDVYIHGVMMALNTSFAVENYSAGPSDFNDCESNNGGRGCLYLTGGLIQKNRGAVGLVSGEGFVKRYSYDRCAIINPPPYFPTTGVFKDNRYYELNPVGFNAAQLYQSISPDK